MWPLNPDIVSRKSGWSLGGGGGEQGTPPSIVDDEVVTRESSSHPHFVPTQTLQDLSLQRQRLF